MASTVSTNLSAKQLTFCKVHRISLKKMRPNRKAKQKKEITEPVSNRNRRDHRMCPCSGEGFLRFCQTKVVLGMSMRIKRLA